MYKEVLNDGRYGYICEFSVHLELFIKMCPQTEFIVSGFAILRVKRRNIVHISFEITNIHENKKNIYSDDTTIFNRENIRHIEYAFTNYFRQ